MKKEKPSAKYHFDRVKWRFKKTFEVDKNRGVAPAFVVTPILLGGATVFSFLPDYTPPVEPDFDKAPISAQYQDHLDQNIIPPLSEASASLKQAERTLHIAKFDKTNTAAEQLDVDTAKLKYDYEAEKAFISVVGNSEMTEIGLESFIGTYLADNVKYQDLDPALRDECLLEGKRAGLKLCMSEYNGDDAPKDAHIFAQASIALMSGIFLMLGMLVTGREIKPGPKPKRKDYIKLGN